MNYYFEYQVWTNNLRDGCGFVKSFKHKKDADAFKHTYQMDGKGCVDVYKRMVKDYYFPIHQYNRENGDSHYSYVKARTKKEVLTQFPRWDIDWVGDCMSKQATYDEAMRKHRPIYALNGVVLLPYDAKGFVPWK